MNKYDRRKTLVKKWKLPNEFQYYIYKLLTVPSVSGLFSAPPHIKYSPYANRRLINCFRATEFLPINFRLSLSPGLISLLRTTWAGFQYSPFLGITGSAIAIGFATGTTFWFTIVGILIASIVKVKMN